MPPSDPIPTSAAPADGPASPNPDAAAVAELVATHAPIVHHQVSAVIGKLPRYVAADDLVAAGMVGLVQAARVFDPGRGVPFHSFATVRVRGAILDELRRMDWASRSVRPNARRVNAATEALTSRYRRPPTVDEVAAELGVSPAEIRRMTDDVRQAQLVRLDILVAHDTADEILPPLGAGPEDSVLGRERVGYMLDAIECLPDRLRCVVVEYFLRERPMQEIADELGVTESRVSQMRAEALALLRDAMNAQLDPDLVAPEPRPGGRVARRKAAYYAAVAARSDFRTRLDTGTSTERVGVSNVV